MAYMGAPARMDGFCFVAPLSAHVNSLNGLVFMVLARMLCPSTRACAHAMGVHARVLT